MSLSFPSNVPLLFQAYLLKNIELENGENSSITSSFAICPCYEEPSFASFEDGIDRVLLGVGINNMRWNSKIP